MSSNFREFDARMEQRKKAIALRVADAKRELLVFGVTTAVELSPVDKGDLRGAWRISSSPDMAAPETPDKDGGATIARAEIDASRIEPYSIAYIINAAPHARRIEDGWSGQAPNGVLGITADRMQVEAGRR